jgi:hypothetical protein
MHWILWLGLAQEPQDKKEFDQRVSEALASFRQAYKGGEEQKLAALAGLKGLAHDRVFSELSRCSTDSSVEVKKKVISLLSEHDHPRAADILAAMVRPNIKDKAILEALQNAAGRVRWDSLMGEMASQTIEPFVFDKERGSVSTGMVKVAEMTGSLVFVDHLIAVLKKLEPVLRNPKHDKSVDGYKETLMKAFKACTGEEHSDSKSWEAWWNGAKSSLRLKARVVLWCKSTGKRWDRMAGDSGAYCPHHGDKATARREGTVEIMRTLK